MRIGIDARFVGPEGTGLGKYTEKLIESLQKVDTQNHYFIFLRKKNWEFLKIHAKNFKKVAADIPWYSLKEQVKLPRIFNSQNLDLLHVPHFNTPILYRGKFVVTIHDLIHHHFSEQSVTTQNLFNFKVKRFAYRIIIARAIKKSAKILTPSKYIKDQIVKIFNVDQNKIIVTYEAAEEEYFINQKPETRNQKPFILYVGNAYPHKNLNRLLDAFKILTTHYSLLITHLIIVCPRDLFFKRLRAEIQKRNLKGNVTLTGYLKTQKLSWLLKKAKAYVFPSLSEGFGIPGLNAMAAQIPVICSNIPTLKEVYGDAVLYFNPKDPKDIAAKINQVIKDKKIRLDLVKKGIKQVKRYSWHKMAKETLKVYEETR